ncbi:PigN-domain-containing protein [Cucurbitaria berberidis CBS 394.84]|uniref:GPI ethanolamine phosphate transferase 1 n=1 Tax=Cucurbitaria berberidis CBS 394.84 TaxID=1168544 RepID=A0A9P4GCV3_9PLEO|nr:PigN-domain-containing protein [Cucurbitaria berberidis CBS 394.84]KAF1843568.1 PigN-domain-containing protein [Cucurbitaria berberidis CBS 394.84]
MREHRVETQEAPANRLVLFVGDGLRADKAFQSFPNPDPNAPTPLADDPAIPRPLAPYLRSRVLESGTFGVSHTRVPTESRPGHVALIAGLYEDVSAVTTGWKLNPVNFDSVFNRSRHTWSWGSPDILPMFEHGAVPGRVDSYCYEAEIEDFSKDGWGLDEWVFERVKKLFTDAKTNATLDAELRQEKNVFFLHLLGLDIAGHGHRPYSWQYLHNIQFVDQGVQEITRLIEEFYDDDKTAFVFTADHGMSDWGSHGDGHPDNTRTPLIAWGAGVATPVKNTSGVAQGHDEFSSDWGLDEIERHDVDQADVAALMAYLVGLDFPTNSVGVLPLSYLSTDTKTKAEALLVNAKEILEMYHVKEELKKSSELRYQPFPGLGDEAHSVEHRVSQIQQAIDDDKVDEAILQTYELIDLGLEGMRYLQRYDWLFLRTLVTAGYVGWIVFAITTVIDLHVLTEHVPALRTTQSIAMFSGVLVALFAVILKQRSPWVYYVYAFFPVLFWEEVYARRGSLTKGGKILFGHVSSNGDIAKLVLSTLGFFGLLEALVQSYFVREIYTVCYLLATCWPAVYGQVFMKKNLGTVATWVLSCIIMSAFTMLPANKAEDTRLILLGGGLMFAVGALYLFFEKHLLADAKSDDELAEPRLDDKSRIILSVQLGLVLLSMIVTKSSIGYTQARQGLPLGVLVVGWATLVASLVVPQLHGLYPNSHYVHRLVVIFLQFAPTFIILTISYEGLFYFAFFLCLFSWMRLEHQVSLHTTQTQKTAAASTNPLKPAIEAAADRLGAIRKGDYRSLTLADARIALFFFFFIQSAFFSASNIASVSSFSLDAVARLIPVFDPFSQGALLMLKLMVPFAALSANFGLLNRRLGVAPSALFMVVMAVSDVMTLNFFFMVKDEGSWLDIGTTISHFVIASLLGVFVAGLEMYSEWTIKGVEFSDGRKAGTQSNGRSTKGKVNGQSNYVEHDAPPRSQSFDEYAEKRPESSRKESHQQDPTTDAEMYPRPQQPQETAYPQGVPNGSHNAMPIRSQQIPNMGIKQPEPMPDLLTAAFNQAVRPYTEKIEQLESQLADMQAWVDQLEQQRAEVHNWIDKRGLRPDVPASIAKIMDTTTSDAAPTLNAQLDRKITIVNFDLHRLQDDLNDSISSSHFASAMLKFLPDIQRLTLLPSGPRYAFDLILKLGGNLNSHGGIDSADASDIAARRDFYTRLDEAMVDVVQRRFGESEDWNVQREIKRIEKTASYLKTYGVEPYFPQTLEMMKREMEFQQPNGVPNGQGTPPRYH